ncbi:hypothetical protein ACFE04_008545 [Oxalis oulophora]
MAPRLNPTSLPKKENLVVNEDRLSFLPNDVAHRILSFLSIDEIGMLSLASKSCEKLCLSVPSLIIDDNSLSLSKGFMDFLEHFMRSRRGAKLTKLSIMSSCGKLKYNEIFCFMWLLNHAMECQVNDIDIELSLETGVVFVMPPDVLCCESLISLKIDLTYDDEDLDSIVHGALEFPSPHGFAYLRSLHLISLRIDGDSLGEQISYVCKFLEKLTLEYLSAMQKFKISSQSLLELTILGCSIEHLDISATSLQTISLRHDKIITSTNVYAPNLLRFIWYENSCENLNFVENPSLLHTLDLTLGKDYPEMIKLDNLLPIIVQVSYLIINPYTIQALYEDRHLQLVFNNLLKLDLHLDYYSSLTAPLVQNISRFLQGLPCSLKKLHIMTYSFKLMAAAVARGASFRVKGRNKMKLNGRKTCTNFCLEKEKERREER